MTPSFLFHQNKKTHPLHFKNHSLDFPSAIVSRASLAAILLQPILESLLQLGNRRCLFKEVAPPPSGFASDFGQESSFRVPSPLTRSRMVKAVCEVRSHFSCKKSTLACAPYIRASRIGIGKVRKEGWSHLLTHCQLSEWLLL